ncbi:hypothetical protein B0H34DRAFT_732431 [Crassisporium funariophilum]|nr:hypothetical protein B0H34DRAFT_732431 [Crassisporium funariophilum]
MDALHSHSTPEGGGLVRNEPGKVIPHIHFDNQPRLAPGPRVRPSYLHREALQSLFNFPPPTVIMASDLQERILSDTACDIVDSYLQDSDDELNTDEEEDGDFYDGYGDRYSSRASTPSSATSNDDVFDEDLLEESQESHSDCPSKFKRQLRDSTATIKAVAHEPEPTVSDKEPESQDSRPIVAPQNLVEGHTEHV